MFNRKPKPRSPHKIYRTRYLSRAEEIVRLWEFEGFQCRFTTFEATLPEERYRGRHITMFQVEQTQGDR